MLYSNLPHQAHVLTRVNPSQAPVTQSLKLELIIAMFFTITIN